MNPILSFQITGHVLSFSHSFLTRLRIQNGKETDRFLQLTRLEFRLLSGLQVQK